jgi:hypothetical protein
MTPSPPASRPAVSVRIAVLALCASALFFAALLELALRSAQALGVFHSETRLTEGEPFYQHLSPVWGIWHPPNTRFVARADCFERIYESNSYGARDRERELHSEAPRVVVLGDSFVEGVGSELERRMTNRLEAKAGIEFLNFGSAAGFSSTQQWLLYRDLASRFDHDLVLLFHFPNNDFLENDPALDLPTRIYRPYLVKDASGAWQPEYRDSFEAMRERDRAQLSWNRWYNALFVYRFGSWLRDQIDNRRMLAQVATTELGYNGYVNYSEADLERLFEGYRRLRDEARGREILIFSLPRLSELEYARLHPVADALPRRLADFASRERGFRYVDLLPGFLADAERSGRSLADYFIPCDGHWSDLGNELAADLALASFDPAALGRARR